MYELKVYAALLVLLAAVLAGCGGGVEERSDGKPSSMTDVRIFRPKPGVECVYVSGIEQGGLDCDWDAAR